MTIFTLLIFLLVLVNGWTDAAGSIAGCVGSRTLSPRKALILAALCNLIGAVGMAVLSTGVVKTVFGIADFGKDPSRSLAALSSGIAAAVLWAVIAWRFGIPTSESHGLLAGISGAALVGCPSLSSIRWEQWGSVLLGLLLTTVPPFLAAFFLIRLLRRLLVALDRRRTMRAFRGLQLAGAAGSALMHGAQDSQKFLGVFLLGHSLLLGDGALSEKLSPVATVPVALVMSLGTLLGGGRIIKKVGSDMSSPDPMDGGLSDVASALILLLCSLLGLPASTTHAKTCAMMGVGAATPNRLKIRIVLQMLLAWLLTFPICFLLGYLLALLTTSLPWTSNI